MSVQPNPPAVNVPVVTAPFRVLRWVLAGLAIGVTLVVIVWSLYYYHDYRSQYVVGSGTTPTLKRTELTKFYFDLKQEQAKNVGQAVMLLAAAVWGLLIAKSDETRIILGDWPEIVMFICFNLIVLAYFVFSYLITNALISSLYVLVKNQEKLQVEYLPDFSGTSIELLSQFTFWVFVAALLVAFFTFFSAHRLK